VVSPLGRGTIDLIWFFVFHLWIFICNISPKWRKRFKSTTPSSPPILPPMVISTNRI
jgi:hypothetical protein